MAFNWLRGDTIHKTVILDTNAVLMLFDFSLQLEQELIALVGKCDIVIPSSVVDELQILARRGGGGVQQAKAKAAFELVKRYTQVDTEGRIADDAVFDLAKQMHGVVVTNDRLLRERLKKNGVPVVFLRSKKKLVLE